VTDWVQGRGRTTREMCSRKIQACRWVSFIVLGRAVGKRPWALCPDDAIYRFDADAANRACEFPSRASGHVQDSITHEGGAIRSCPYPLAGLGYGPNCLAFAGGDTGRTTFSLAALL